MCKWVIECVSELLNVWIWVTECMSHWMWNWIVAITSYTTHLSLLPTLPFLLQRAFLTSRNTIVVTVAIQCVTNAQNFAMGNVTARTKTTVISALTWLCRWWSRMAMMCVKTRWSFRWFVWWTNCWTTWISISVCRHIAYWLSGISFTTSHIKSFPRSTGNGAEQQGSVWSQIDPHVLKRVRSHGQQGRNQSASDGYIRKELRRLCCHNLSAWHRWSTPWQHHDWCTCQSDLKRRKKDISSTSISATSLGRIPRWRRLVFA